MRTLCLIACLFLSADMLGQQTGEVDYPFLGIRFTIPPGWKGAETGGGFLIGHDTKPGFVFLMPNEVSDLETLKAEARNGLYDDGISMNMISDFEEIGSGGVGAEFEGNIQGTPARAFIAGVINPFGMGVTIMATTDYANYSAAYKALAKDVAMSLKFSHPKEPPMAKEWKEALSGATLTYMNSSYSSGASYDGYSTYSGYSSHVEILLCPSGVFSYSNSSSMSIDTGGGFAGSGDKGNSQGRWSLTSDAGGSNVLKLEFSNGEVSTYTLGFEDDKTYLNGERYFRTYKQSCY